MNELFAIIGGDRRQISLANRFAKEGLRVNSYGLPCDKLLAGVTAHTTWQDAIVGASAVLLPLPASPDGVRINVPLSPTASPPAFLELLRVIPRDIPMIGGRFTPAMREAAEQMGKTLYDYCKEEEFQQKNAIPTAEGAVAILMERETHTIKGLSVAITGFGRVAKALAFLLLAMGANVTVGARRQSALEEASALGCKTVRLCGEESMFALVRDKAAVFNTVPQWIFTREVLEKLSPDTLLIDLASAPGGVDGEAARGLSRSVIWALSLPGKYAPDTAGEIIAETVLSLMEREGNV